VPAVARGGRCARSLRCARHLRDVGEAEVAVLPDLADALRRLELADHELHERGLARAVPAEQRA
jgi:hypothetical protein